MPMYNFIEKVDNYQKTSGCSQHYYRDKLFLNADCTIGDFPTDNNSSASFKFKTKIEGNMEENANTKMSKLEYH